jgi:hypothetical protein
MNFIIFSHWKMRTHIFTRCLSLIFRERSKFASLTSYERSWDMFTDELLRVVTKKWPDSWTVAARISERLSIYNLKRSPDIKKRVYEYNEATNKLRSLIKRLIMFERFFSFIFTFTRSLRFIRVSPDKWIRRFLRP